MTDVSYQVVEEPSAVLDGLQYIVLDSDHLKLNKFAGEHDGNYVSVSSSIARIAAEAPRLVQNRGRGQFTITLDAACHGFSQLTLSHSKHGRRREI